MKKLFCVLFAIVLLTFGGMFAVSAVSDSLDQETTIEENVFSRFYANKDELIALIMLSGCIGAISGGIAVYSIERARKVK